MKTLYSTFNGSCIYTIINKENGNRYIGSATNFQQRRWKHTTDLNTKKHHSIYLQRAWNKHGPDAFEMTIVEECSKESLIEREQYFIDLYKPEYNMCRIAGSCLGKRHSKEAKLKMSIAKKGMKLSKSHIENIVNSRRNNGYVITQETKNKISLAQSGSKAGRAKFSDDQIRDIRNLHDKGKGVRELARMFNVDFGCMGRILRNETYINPDYKKV